MAKLAEQAILQAVYSTLETDTTDWAVTDDEYLAGRRYCNAAINKWETATIETETSQMPVRWRELRSTLTAASDGTKTITAGTYAYAAPTNMVEPSSYVRTVNSAGNSTYWNTLPPEKIAMYANDYGYWCYFTGNQKDGFTLNFNSRITLTTAETINYEYYKSATTFTAVTSKTEMMDDYFIVEYVSAQFYKDEDLNLYRVHIDKANAKLNLMITKNQMGYENVPDSIGETLAGENTAGFGY